MGEGKWGQLGLGTAQNVFQPKIIEALKENSIVSLSCGWKHSVVVTGELLELCSYLQKDTGRVFIFGNGRFGQLGLGKEVQSLLIPKEISNQVC